MLKTHDYSGVLEVQFEQEIKTSAQYYVLLQIPTANILSFCRNSCKAQSRSILFMLESNLAGMCSTQGSSRSDHVVTRM